ncbi:MAG: hypothetical protein O7E52_12085 [Candidatus Poribacteria bacterium]|nr:hypothetical protein [Candidatus Poribacteria bacterium]
MSQLQTYPYPKQRSDAQRQAESLLHECGRQFVDHPEPILISDAKRERRRKRLLERGPLRGICRVEGVSLRWLLGFITDFYQHLPDD